MKVLFNTYYHAFQNPGGGEIVLKKTREALMRQGVHVDLFDQWNTKLSEYDIIHNFSTINYRDFDGLKSYIPKLVVTPVMWPDISPKAILKEKLKASYNQILDRTSSEINFSAALKNVDRFFPTTSSEWSRINKRYSLNSKFKVIYNGVEKPQPATGTFSEHFHVQDYLLFVGRISPLKNVHTIIESAKMSGQKLVIIGKSDLNDREYEKKLREENKGDSNIIFTGPLEHDSPLLNDAYYEAKSLVVASQFETCSLTGLEAGIRGTQVLMTEKGATNEVYKDHVIYIDPNNPTDIASKMNSRFTSEQKQKLKNFIDENYNWNHIAGLLASEYLETLKT